MKLHPIILKAVVVALLAFVGEARAQTCNPAYSAFCLIEPTAAGGDDVAPYCFLPTLTRGQYETNYAVTTPAGSDCHSFDTYLRFALPEDLLSPGETVTSATLLLPYLFSFSFDGPVVPPPHAPVTIRLHRVTSFWNENAVTWANKPGYDATPVAQVTGVTNYGVREFDVTSLVRDWAAGAKPNFGFAITSPNDRTLGFYSWESPVPSAQKPALLIVTGPGTPPAPVPTLPGWLAALLVIGIAIVLALPLRRAGTLAFVAALVVAAPAPVAFAQTAAHDPSVWGMFLAAGDVAKAVMVLLVIASIWNVAVMIEKSVTLRRVNREADAFLEKFRRARSLETLSVELPVAAGSPMLDMFRAGMSELHLSVDSGLADVGEFRDRMRARVVDAMEITRTHATYELGRSMSLLATIGSTAPFVGLFGTVWGIMTSFIGIAQTQTTSLAVVAPGIAEALLATAIGLAAAIPAVVLYNKFSRAIGRFSGRLQSFESEFAIVLSRQLDLKA